MPNWCSNVVTIRGKKEEVERFREFVKSVQSEFDFDKLVPQPDEVLASLESNTSSPGSMPDWYDWRCENWGTKWNNDDEVHVSTGLEAAGEDMLVEYSFDTAWSPPLPVIHSAAIQFPELVFSISYEEPGCNFAGEIEVKGEEVLSQWKGECPSYEDEEEEEGDE